MRDQLCVDLGNSRIATGYFQDSNLIQKWYHPLSKIDSSYKKIRTIQSQSKSQIPVIISSVVPSSSGRLFELLNNDSIPNELININTQSIIKNTYPTMGTDRLCNIVAALRLYTENGEAAIVLDFGTATTLSAVDGNGVFLGGLITLGLKNTLKSVNSTLEQLPILNVNEEFDLDKLSPLAKTTDQAIFNGTLFGHIGMVEAWLKRLSETLKMPYKTIATGGLASIIAKHIDGIACIDEDLTLKGLNLLGALAEDRVDPG